LGALTKGLPQSNCYVDVLRDAMSVDSLDKCGIYFGTTEGRSTSRRTRGIPGTPLSATCRQSCRWKYRPWRERLGGPVLLPAHLKTLAGVRGEVKIDVAGTSAPRRSSTLSKRHFRRCAVRSVILSRVNDGRSCVSSWGRDLSHQPSTKNYPRASPRVMRPSSSSARWRAIADPGSLAAQRYFIETREG